jgi:transmembrane secretion effector
VPAVGATVAVTVGNTAWMGGSGDSIFVTGAGCYQVASITDATHAVLTNVTFLAATGLAIVAMIITRLPSFRLSIDFTTDLNLEPAPVTIFSNNPSRLPEPQEGPLSITTEFQVDADRRQEFFDLAGKARLIYLRNGAHGWHLKEELARANSFQIEVIIQLRTGNIAIVS